MIVLCSHAGINFAPGQVTYIAEEGSSKPHTVIIDGVADDLLDPPTFTVEASHVAREITDSMFL